MLGTACDGIAPIGAKLISDSEGSPGTVPQGGASIKLLAASPGIDPIFSDPPMKYSAASPKKLLHDDTDAMRDAACSVLINPSGVDVKNGAFGSLPRLPRGCERCKGPLPSAAMMARGAETLRDATRSPDAWLFPLDGMLSNA